MKLPNGYGSVYKLPGNRRKPWAIRITVSKTMDEDGKYKWKYKYLGYYETHSEALNALALYNTNPYDVDSVKITFAEIYEKWSAEHYPKVSTSNIHGYTAAYKVCFSLHNMKFNEIKKSHLQHIVDTCGKNFPTLRKIKVLFNMLFKFAMQNDVCSKDYSEFVDIIQYKNRNPDKINRSPFSIDEIEQIWKAIQVDEYYQQVLILIYTGIRISEFWELKKEDVFLEKRYFEVKKSKTQAGIRRVPIAEKLYPFFEYWMNAESDYVFCNRQNKKFTDKNFRDSYWKPMMKNLDMESHRPHDTRHTCVSLLTKAQVDDKTIKKIVGHAGQGITEQVYTHFELQQLLDAINKI